MFGGSSRQARRPFNSSWGKRGTAAGAERFNGVTGKLPPDQGRAPCLYDEQLQRQQQEKILQGREARPDLLSNPSHR
jgi:hypothetical protein